MQSQYGSMLQMFVQYKNVCICKLEVYAEI